MYTFNKKMDKIRLCRGVLISKKESLTSTTAWMGLKHTTERRVTQPLRRIPFTQKVQAQAEPHSG